MQATASYDLILLGSGLGNTTLASIMAKQGFKVLILEQGSHPRFAVGESLVFRSALWAWILGRTYDVPEIAYLSSLEDISTKMSPRCGSKLTFGFLYHREGREQIPSESNRLIPPVLKLLSESHLYREDVDLYLLNTAIKYGADYLEKCDIADIDLERPDGVRVTTADGLVFDGRYLVDGAGFRSPLAEKLDHRLPEEEDLKTHSRAIFSLFENVPAYDDLVPEGTFPKHTSKWHEGTLHHVFDGGWMWVIPFDNHKRTTNKQCSVGLMLDPRKFPMQKDMSPQEEFFSFIQRFPSVARHMQHAKPTMKFIRTGRIQYGSQFCAGPRYCQLHHAFSFIDPLFSRGIIRTMESIYALVPRLREALLDNDFSMERFEYLNEMQTAQMRFTDKLVSNAYRSMANYSMWNALLHQWMGNELASAVFMLRRCFLSMKTGSLAPLQNLEEVSHAGKSNLFNNQMQAIYELHSRQLDRAEAGEISYEEAAMPVFEELAKKEFLPPLYGWSDPKATHADFAPPQALLKLLIWGKTIPSASIRKNMTDLSASTILKMEVKGARLKRKKQKMPLCAPPPPPVVASWPVNSPIAPATPVSAP
jgi:tetracycline 7-halogenase / FADH2 O2-dependent halogenase